MTYISVESSWEGLDAAILRGKGDVDTTSRMEAD